MARQIFRKAALDRLSLPERLDRPIRLVGAPGWLIVFGFIAAIAVGLSWAFAVSAPVKVTGQGILISRAGLVEIVSDRGGLLESVALAPGDLVAAGQVVARLSSNELRRDLATAEAKLADARERYARLESFYAEQEERQEIADAERRETIEDTRRLLTTRMALLDERVASVTSLLDRQMVGRDDLIEAEIAASNARERQAELDEEALRLRLDAIERESQHRLALLDERLAVEEQEREVARLTERLNDQQVIRSSHAGQVAEVKVNTGDVVDSGTPLATLAPAGGDDLVAVLYVPPADGKRVEAGMVAHISPTTVEREVYGHILAEVTTVAPLPATEEGMRRTLQNDRLVVQLSAAGAPIEVRIQLHTDENTPTGFAWSSSRGPDNGVNGGTLIEGRIVVDEVPVVDLIVPGAANAITGRD